MPRIKRKTVSLTTKQDAFIKKKKQQIQRAMPPGDEDRVTESGVIQGLIDFWMAFDARIQSRE